MFGTAKMGSWKDEGANSPRLWLQGAVGLGGVTRTVANISLCKGVYRAMPPCAVQNLGSGHPAPEILGGRTQSGGRRVGYA